MTQKPFVSIIMPSFQGERYIGAAVESVLAQEFGDWELLIVDDGSTDRTIEIVSGFVDPRIRVLRGEHCGSPGAVRNRGIAASRGPYIAFLDCDDIWLPPKLRKQVDYVRGHPASGVNFCCYRYLYGDGSRVGRRVMPDVRGFSNPFSAAVPLLLGRSPQTSTELIRRDLLLAVKGFRKDGLAEDVELNLRLAERTLFGFIPQPLCLYRIHDASLSRRELLMAMSLYEVEQSSLQRNPAVLTVEQATKLQSLQIERLAMAKILDGKGRDARAAILALRDRGPKFRSAVLLATSFVPRILIRPLRLLVRFLRSRPVQTYNGGFTS